MADSTENQLYPDGTRRTGRSRLGRTGETTAGGSKDGGVGETKFDALLEKIHRDVKATYLADKLKDRIRKATEDFMKRIK